MKSKSAAGRLRISPGAPKQAATESFPVVGIGASAGGYEAFTKFLEELPLDSGVAVVLVQHLDPKHESKLTELLSRSTRLPVIEVIKTVTVEPNHVYVIPPNKYLAITGGRLKLSPRQQADAPPMPVDFFLRSLAEDQRENAIGIIFSGNGSDGTLGLRAIKAAEGLTFAQDPKTARYTGMPGSAIASGCVDFILPPQGMARELAKSLHRPGRGSVDRDSRAENAMRAREAELRLIMDISPIMLVRCSREMRYVFVNRSYAEFLGLAPKQIMGKPIAEIMGTGAFKVIQPHVKKVLDGKSVEYETEIPYERQGRRFMRVALRPDMGEEGNVRGWVAAISDITEHKRAEEMLRESEKRFRTMADAAPVLIWMSGTDKLCNYFNKGWMAFTGRTLEQEFGNGWTKGVHPDDLPRYLKTYVNCFEARQQFEIEYRLRRHDGEYRWILDHGIPRFTSANEFLGYIGSCVDINERKQWE
jgi:PAS domain S-box-containing protein